MDENQTLCESISELQLAVLEMSARMDELEQEVDEAREKAQIADDFASSTFEAMLTVLPFLLRDHSAAAEVGKRLKVQADRFLELTAGLAIDERISPDARLYEGEKMLYFHLAEAGVLPGMTPGRVAQEVLPHYER